MDRIADWRKPLVFAVGILVFHFTPLHAQQEVLSKEAYVTPPKVILDAVLASRDEHVALNNLSPDGKKFVVAHSDGLPTLERLGRAYVHLGEMIFDQNAYRERTLWVQSGVGFDLFSWQDKRTVPVRVPERARVSNPVWSPDGSMLAFYAHFDDGTYIYIADSETGYSRRLCATPVVATLDTSFQWSKDGKRIETLLLPDDARQNFSAPKIAAEPRVRVAHGKPSPSRTYRYLLESPYDMKLLEQLVTAQLALVDIDDGKVSKIGFPSMIRSVIMAPGEADFRITTLKKPFSYFVPLTRFGTTEGIWNAEGKSLYTLADRDLRDTDMQPAPVATQVIGQGGGGRRGRGRGAGQFAGQNPPSPADPARPAPAPAPLDPTDPGASARAGQVLADASGRRDIAWRPDGASLSFLQVEPPAQDANQPRKDRVMQWVAPFGKDDAKVVYATTQPISAVAYSADCRMIFLTQAVAGQRQISAVDLSEPQTTHVIYKAAGRGGPATRPTTRPANDGVVAQDSDSEDESFDDEQLVPGFGRGGRGGRGGFALTGAVSLLTRSNPGQVSVVRMSSGGDVYLNGSDRGSGGYAKPYIDRVNVMTAAKKRIFEAKGDMFETIDAVDSDDLKYVFTTRQKADVVPDSYVTDVSSGKTTKLTSNENHTAWFNQLKVERFRVTRVDGFKFWVKVTTPSKRTGKLPAMFWIYPREYSDQASYDAANAGTLAASNRFAAPTPRSIALLALLDYAVIEPDVPIVGPPGRMNDNYIPDLRNSLWAVIDELDKRGIIDRDRLACGGHSYGTFSTANAMAHTPFFKAGIAGDGNYNRTLTSMTFQTERRDIWDARETYLEMSPLLWANRVNGALLMYHSMDDANVGTDPINAQHMFMALDGLGKPAALYMYPYEDHGPVARETILDQWARWCAWLDKYVKDPKRT